MSKIIVVDDDHANTTLIQMLLELDGFSVEACDDVEQAKLLASADTDAFVIDFHLARGLKGMDLLQAVRGGETNAPLDTVVIISSGDYRRESEVMEAGADLFLFKPYPPNILSQELRKLLAGSQ